ncbi:MAG: hypothetical protein IJV34_04875 [Prevotella sp.]|nr:hypothetical protein [Prevotella sp.]
MNKIFHGFDLCQIYGAYIPYIYYTRAQRNRQEHQGPHGRRQQALAQSKANRMAKQGETHNEVRQTILQSRRVCSTKSTSLFNKVDEFVKQRNSNHFQKAVSFKDPIR